MRLTCPNCDAIYEVPADAVPPEGRDVQCTNCGHSWFQAHPEGALPAELTPAARTVTPDARRVLEEEAEREMAARAEERGRARQPRRAPVPVPRDPEDDIEAQLDDAFTGDPHGFDDQDDIDDEPAPAAVPPRKRRGKDLLPDIEEINGSLKPASERKGGRKVRVEDAEPRGSGRGFRLGLGLMVLLAAALVVLYVFAPDIAARVPALAPAMEGYAGTIDGWRLALDGMARGASEWLTAWVDSLSSPEIEPGEVVIVPAEEG